MAHLDAALTLMLVNAHEARDLPGGKSDASDARWLADLLAHGLMRASFVPPELIRELRDLTRTRTQLQRQMTQHENGIGKVLEDANIKLATVVCELLGISSRRILEALVAGETDHARLAGLDIADKGRARTGGPLTAASRAITPAWS